MKIKTVLVGAGRRVQIDILPSLLAAGILQSEILILRKKKLPLVNFNDVNVIIDFSDMGKFEFEDKCILIINVDQKIVVSVLQNVLTYIDPSFVFIDTPINRVASEVDQIANTKGLDLRVIEDGFLIPWLPLFNRHFLTQNFFAISYRAFYLFHGVASFRQLIGNNFFSGRSFFKGKIFLCSNKDSGKIMQFGSKDYSNGRFFWFFKGKLFYVGKKIKHDGILKRVEVTDFVTESDSQLFSNYAMLLGIDFKKLMDNPIESMREWKRIGLYMGFESILVNNINSFPDTKQIVENEIISGWDEG